MDLPDGYKILVSKFPRLWRVVIASEIGQPKGVGESTLSEQDATDKAWESFNNK